MTTAAVESPFKVNEPIYKWLNASPVRYTFLRGGASSGKSHTVAQHLLLDYFLQPTKLGLLTVRKTRPAVKASCWELVHHYADLAAEIIGSPGPLYEDNKADLTMYGRNGIFWKFAGLDNMYKIRSMEGVNIVWIEEAAAVGSDAAFSERDFHQLDLVCRAGGIERIYVTYNPVDPIGNEWLKKRDDNADADPDSRRLILTHKDNPFLSAAGHKVIEKLQQSDAEYDKIYRLGEWATPTAIIYTNWDIVPKMPERYDQRIWGLDFGYASNPAALTEIRFVGDNVFIHGHIYQTHLTNPELILLLKDIVPKSERLVADSAEPKSIQEIRNAGFNIFGALKGPDSVKYGIKTVKSLKQHITKDSPQIIDEIRGYKWQVDADGNVKSPPKPVELRDHGMDANRYAITHVKGLVKAGIEIATVSEPKEYDPIESDEGWDSCE